MTREVAYAPEAGLGATQTGGKRLFRLWWARGVPSLSRPQAYPLNRCPIALFVLLIRAARDHIMEGHMTAPLVNPLYRPRARQSNSSGSSNSAPPLRDIDLLRPCCEVQGLEIWQAVYMRDNMVLHHR